MVWVEAMASVMTLIVARAECLLERFLLRLREA